jgi:4-amino-4-deoxy-L-arabinose transferase-like glycosyltransferase
MTARRTVFDLAAATAAVACVIAIAAHAPTNTPAHSQIRWIGVWIGALKEGNYLLPTNHMGEVAHKPQLYIWVQAAVLKATGLYNDFIFRLPTVVASLATAAMVYLLGRRWYGRRTGLLAAWLWGTTLLMRRMSYICTTDMLLTMWVTASVLCVDRLLFHRASGRRRWWWAVGLWATMILGGLTKGWGVVNPALVGGFVAMACAARGGFAALRTQKHLARKLLLAARLVGRRWRRAARQVHLLWGLLAMAAVLVPIWVGMFAVGGEQFRQVVQYEIVQRITGSGEAPHRTSAPPVAHLMYYMLPATVFALGAFLVPPRRWFRRASPVALPGAWVLAVVVVFSIPHGFRPDYLLPCFAGGALMAAWAVDELARRGRAPGRLNSFLRHAFAAPAVVIGLFLLLVPPVFLWRDAVPAFVARLLPAPAVARPETWWILAATMGLGAAVLALGVRASLRWRIRRLAVLAVVGMLGVVFVERHMISREARTGEGERMIRFAERVGEAIGDEAFAVYRAERLATEVYLGRFGLRLTDPWAVEDAAGGGGEEGLTRDQLRGLLALRLLRRRDDLRWLVTCDRGLVEFGAAVEDPSGDFTLRAPEGNIRYATRPEALGEAVVASRPVASGGWGRMYLIRLQPERIAESIRGRIYLGARWVFHISGDE